LAKKLADEYFEGMITRFSQIADMPKLYPVVDDIKKVIAAVCLGHILYIIKLPIST